MDHYVNFQSALATVPPVRQRPLAEHAPPDTDWSRQAKHAQVRVHDYLFAPMVWNNIDHAQCLEFTIHP